MNKILLLSLCSLSIPISASRPNPDTFKHDPKESFEAFHAKERKKNKERNTNQTLAQAFFQKKDINKDERIIRFNFFGTEDFLFEFNAILEGKKGVPKSVKMTENNKELSSEKVQAFLNKIERITFALRNAKEYRKHVDDQSVYFEIFQNYTIKVTQFTKFDASSLKSNKPSESEKKSSKQSSSHISQKNILKKNPIYRN